MSTGTNYAVPSILTGDFPSRKCPPTRRNYPANLLTILGEDRRLNIKGSIVSLCPPGQCGEESQVVEWRAFLLDTSVLYPHLILPRNQRRQLPDVTSGTRDFVGDLRSDNDQHRPEVITEVFLDSFIKHQEPTLWGAHFYLPHVPWRYLPGGLQYDPLGWVVGTCYDWPNSRWCDEEDPVELAFRRHLLQSGYADWILGRLLEGLREAGRWDSTLVIVTADHGGGFIPGEVRRELTQDQYAEILNVPLFVKYPNQQEKGVDERWVQTVDIAPTVADVLGFEPLVPQDGLSLLKTGERPVPKLGVFFKEIPG